VLALQQLVLDHIGLTPTEEGRQLLHYVIPQVCVWLSQGQNWDAGRCLACCPLAGCCRRPARSTVIQLRAPHSLPGTAAPPHTHTLPPGASAAAAGAAGAAGHAGQAASAGPGGAARVAGHPGGGLPHSRQAGASQALCVGVGAFAHCLALPTQR
jgi:hypothetical protein